MHTHSGGAEGGHLIRLWTRSPPSQLAAATYSWLRAGAGRRFDTTYAALKRQRGNLEQESTALLHRAVAFHARGHHAEAYNAFEHLLNIDPTNVAVLYSYSYFLAFGLRDHDGAMQLLRRSLDATEPGASASADAARAIARSNQELVEEELRRGRVPPPPRRRRPLLSSPAAASSVSHF